MKQKLKLKLWRTNSTVHMQILEQEGIVEDLSEKVKLGNVPELLGVHICLRGLWKERNDYIDNINFDNENYAYEHINKVVSWLDEIFPAKEPKRGDMIRVSQTPFDSIDYKRGKENRRRFIGTIEGCYQPICVVALNDTQKFLRGDNFCIEMWKYMDFLPSYWNPETGIYEAEREV